MVAIDGAAVVTPAQPTASVFLARGAHAIHVTRPDGAPPPQLRVSLAQATPAPNGASPDGQDPLFFALPPPGGLLLTWQIDGGPVQALVDSAPHRGFEGTFSNGRPWAGQWRGQLRVAMPGDYFFHLEAISTATLFVDGRPVVPINQVGGSGEASITLAPGWHAIRVDYVDRDPYARLFLTWRPPGETGFSEIPDAVLLPALGLP